MIGLRQGRGQPGLADHRHALVAGWFAPVGGHPRAERFQQLRQPPPDGAEADQQHRLPRQHAVGEPVFQVAPLAAAVLVAELDRQVAHEGEHLREHVLGAGIGENLRSVGHRYAASEHRGAKILPVITRVAGRAQLDELN